MPSADGSRRHKKTVVIGMLNPAGALIKIVQALVGVVQWITERGAALVDLVNSHLAAQAV